MSHHLTELLARTARGETPKYLFFWGHTPAQKDVVDKSCFSQWFPAAFDVDGVTYATAEHYMMAQKAALFGDDAIRKKILSAGNPGAAKRLGREVAHFEPELWDTKRFDIVVAGNRAKFGQHPALRECLLRSGDRVLVEASPVDRIWGVGLAADDPLIQHPETWNGLNLLGFALMVVRDEMQ